MSGDGHIAAVREALAQRDAAYGLLREVGGHVVDTAIVSRSGEEPATYWWRPAENGDVDVRLTDEQATLLRSILDGATRLDPNQPAPADLLERW